MYRVRNRMKPWYARWPWNKLLPQKVDERYCRECGLPYVNRPVPKELAQFSSGNITAFVLPGGDWRRERFSVRLGRWRAYSGNYYLSEFIPSDEWDDVEQVIIQVHEYRQMRAGRNTARRTAPR